MFAVLRSGEPENHIKGVSVGKALLDAGLSQNCEDSTTDYALTGTTWAGTALTGFRPLSPTDCPVDSRVAAQCLYSLFAGIVHAFGAQHSTASTTLDLPSQSLR